MNVHHRIRLTTFIFPIVFGSTALGDEHLREALRHADDAVHSAGDSKAIEDHAVKALEHLDQAKEANAAQPQVLEYIHQSEQELNSAATKAGRFNSTTALEDASAATHHLESADETAAGKLAH